MTTYCYPVFSDPKALPICVCGVGVRELESPLCRPDGYSYHQLFICLEGSGKVVSEKKRHNVHIGDALFIPAHLPHELVPSVENWRLIGIDFDGESIQSILQTVKLTKLRCEKLSDHETLVRKMLAIIHAVREESSSSFSDCSALAYDLIMQLHSRININSETPDGQKLSMLSPVVEYIRDNYHSEMTLDELAAIIGLSPQYLCRLFKDCYRMRPFEYLAKVRLCQAKLMLMQEKYSVNEVAQIVGYNDCSYFCSVFKKYEGLSPSEFKAMNLPNEQNA